MNKVTIAFDIDGTLRDNTVDQNLAPIANERIRALLITLSSFKNVEIIVWSGGGEIYARQVSAALGIDKYVDKYASKGIRHSLDENGERQVLDFHPDITPDIAIDDIHDCVLGNINLIVNEK